MNKLLVCGLMLGMLGGSGAIAAEGSKQEAGTSAEKKDSLAGVYDKMAKCLRSDKTMSQCQTEMQKNCNQAMGSEGCPTSEMGGTMGEESSDTQAGKKSDEAKEHIEDAEQQLEETQQDMSN